MRVRFMTAYQRGQAHAALNFNPSEVATNDLTDIIFHAMANNPMVSESARQAYIQGVSDDVNQRAASRWRRMNAVKA